MKKIKTFKHYNDEIINEFLKQTEGVIVNYNPIVIEYEANKKFKDPYEGYNAYEYKCHLTFTPLFNIKDYTFLDPKKVVEEVFIDTVLFNKKNGALKFMRGGRVIFEESSSYFFQVYLLRIRAGFSGDYKPPVSTADFNGEGCDNVCFNLHMYSDSAWGNDFFFEDYLKAEGSGAKQINFN
jgi:hypothetical protein